MLFRILSEDSVLSRLSEPRGYVQDLIGEVTVHSKNTNMVRKSSRTACKHANHFFAYFTWPLPVTLLRVNSGIPCMVMY